jgi:Sortase domain
VHTSTKRYLGVAGVTASLLLAVAVAPAAVRSATTAFSPTEPEVNVVAAEPPWYAGWTIPTQESSVPPPQVAQPAPEPVPEPKPNLGPNRLALPSVGIAAPLGTIELDGNNELSPPFDQPGTAYRWSYAGTVGESPRAAYILGHSCRKPGCTFVFNRLQELKVGDKVYASDAAGVTHAYQVIKTSSPSKKEISATGIFSASTMPNTLFLIACKVREDRAPSTNNFVVQAVLLDS